MLHNFIQFINRNIHLPAGSRVLLAISGGIDSMVLLHLFSQCNFDFGIAHCNFKLRNDESDGDEQFVMKVATKAGKAIHHISFDTTEFAKANKVSTQMAARTLRYNWFEKLIKEHNYDYLAVAHHQTDILETLLINQIRGTGLSGIHGIKVKNGNIIRPLLFATRDEIYNYAVANEISWREDSSNAHDDYMRNKIRLQVLPILKEINPSIERTFAANAEHFSNAEDLIESFLPQLQEEFLHRHNDKCYIDLEKLERHSHPKALLYYLLRDYNFKNNLIDDLAGSLQSEGHKIFYSATHQLVKERKQLIIELIKSDSPVFNFIIDKEGDFVSDNLEIKMERIPISTFDFNFNVPPNIAFFDADTIMFPLKIRSWLEGDFFYPLGMNGKKMLSDYFTDSKVSFTAKQHIPLLLSGDKIIWIVGRRTDERFKVSATTQTVLKISVTADFSIVE